MQVYFRKEVQAFEYVTFTKLELEDKSGFYCERFQKYDSIVKVRSNKLGKFCIVEKDVLTPIDYHPFCGEKIKYVSVE